MLAGSPEAAAEEVKQHPTTKGEIAEEAKPTKGIEPGFLYYKNGDRVGATLAKIHKDYLTFNLTQGGEVMVQPSDLIEYWSGENFALFKKGVRIRLDTPIVGKINIRGEDIFITPEGKEPIEIEAVDVNECVNYDTFLYEMKKDRPWYKDWRANVGFGVSVNRSTEDGTAFNSELSLNRTEPDIVFLPERSRVTVLVTDEYQRVTGPSFDSENPEFREEHTLYANAEYDHTLHKQFFALGVFTFDRNHSQQLLSQPSYGAGFGWTIYKTDVDEIVLKTSWDYRTQDFEDYTYNTKHVGQKVSQTLNLSLPHNMQLNEMVDADVAYNDSKNISGRASVELRIPVYRSIGMELSASDDYLNAPYPGTDRNSYRLVTRLTYSF